MKNDSENENNLEMDFISCEIEEYVEVKEFKRLTFTLDAIFEIEKGKFIYYLPGQDSGIKTVDETKTVKVPTPLKAKIINFFKWLKFWKDTDSVKSFEDSDFQKKFSGEKDG